MSNVRRQEGGEEVGRRGEEEEEMNMRGLSSPLAQTNECQFCGGA